MISNIIHVEYHDHGSQLPSRSKQPTGEIVVEVDGPNAKISVVVLGINRPPARLSDSVVLGNVALSRRID